MATGSSAAPLFISASDVRELVSMSDLVKVLGPTFRWFSTGTGVVQPVRVTVPVPDRDGFMLSMPGYCQGANSLAIKILTFYPGNSKKGIPTLQGIILVFDPDTGILKALVDGIVLTDMRTAAASACAMKALLTTPPITLCIVGTGSQARSHVEALTDCFSFSKVIIWGRNKSHAEKCAQDVGGNNVEVCESLEEAVKDADVIATVTMPVDPVLYGKWCKPGVVVCSVGASRPDRRELDDELIHNSVVIVDSREAALKESGDIIIPKAEIYAEIGEILAGTKPLPKVPDCGKKFIVFKSLGMAVEDVVSARLVYDRYVQRQERK